MPERQDILEKEGNMSRLLHHVNSSFDPLEQFGVDSGSSNTPIAATPAAAGVAVAKGAGAAKGAGWVTGVGACLGAGYVAFRATGN